VNLQTGVVSDGDLLHSFESVIGSPFADRIRGTRLTNFLFGRAGDDVLRGLASDDRMRGGDGNDLLDGGPGADDCRGGPGTDTLLSC
jgi:serralysin